MKNKKMKKLLITFLLIILAILIFSRRVYGVDNIIGGIANGVVGVLLIIPKVLLIILGDVAKGIMGLISGHDNGLSVADILFNDLPITDIDFFNFNSPDNTVNEIRENVAAWYVGIRNLAAVLLVIVALYVGIRMALSTIAEDKAKYKQMLVDWVSSICILFLLHYIMIIIIQVNNTLVSTLGDKQNLKNQGLDEIAEKFKNYAYDTSRVFTKWIPQGHPDDTASSFAAAIIYLMLQVITLIFLLSYIKRMITIGFLIIIAPLVTVTYSMDRMGDGKSQALNAWLKEFTYNILIQPFQCITYLALCSTAFDILRDEPDFKSAVIAIAMLIFLISSEQIIKHIFHFQSSSMADNVAAAGLTMAGFRRLTSVGSKRFGDDKDSEKQYPTPKTPLPSNGNGGPNDPGQQPGNAGEPSNRQGNEGSSPSQPRNAGALPSPSGNGENGGTNMASNSLGSANNSSSGGNSSPNTTSSSGNSRRTGRRKAGSRARDLGARAASGYLRFVEGAFRVGAGIAIGGATGKFENIPLAVSEVGSITSDAAKRHSRNIQTSHYKKEVARAFEDYRAYKESMGENISLEQAGADGMEFLQGSKDPQTEEEMAYRDALERLRMNYKKNGYDDLDSIKNVNNVVNGVIAGEITEQWAPPKFVVSTKDKWDRLMARSGRRPQRRPQRGPQGQQGPGQRGQGQQGQQGPGQSWQQWQRDQGQQGQGDRDQGQQGQGDRGQGQQGQGERGQRQQGQGQGQGQQDQGQQGQQGQGQQD